MSATGALGSTEAGLAALLGNKDGLLAFTGECLGRNQATRIAALHALARILEVKYGSHV